jgi:hypothetical protein
LPEKSSLRISSKRRACGTFSSRCFNSRIGAFDLASISRPSLAERRAARSIRTGSSR